MSISGFPMEFMVSLIGSFTLLYLALSMYQAHSLFVKTPSSHSFPFISRRVRASLLSPGAASHSTCMTESSRAWRTRRCSPLGGDTNCSGVQAGCHGPWPHIRKQYDPWVSHTGQSAASATSFHPWMSFWTVSRCSPYKHLTLEWKNLSEKC